MEVPPPPDMEGLIRREYGVDVPMIRGSFDEATNAAFQSTRYLIVYLHNPNHETTEDFIVNVLGKDPFRKLLQDKASLWSCDVTTSDGADIGKLLRVTTFPFLAVFFKKNVVVTMQGADMLSLSRVITELQRGMDNWDTLMAKEISYRHDRESRTLAHMQEEAEREERLRKDREMLEEFEAKEAQRRKERAEREQREKEEQEKLRQLKAEAERQQREEELRRKQAEAAEQEAKDALELERSLAASRSPPPPPPDANPNDVLSVSIRFPKKAVERRFFVSNEVEDLYSFAESTEEYTGRKFTLMMSGMPPKPIERCSSVSLSTVFGSQKRIAIMVREL